MVWFPKSTRKQIRARQINMREESGILNDLYNDPDVTILEETVYAPDGMGCMNVFVKYEKRVRGNEPDELASFNEMEIPESLATAIENSMNTVEEPTKPKEKAGGKRGKK